MLEDFTHFGAPVYTVVDNSAGLCGATGVGNVVIPHFVPPLGGCGPSPQIAPIYTPCNPYITPIIPVVSIFPVISSSAGLLMFRVLRSLGFDIE